MKLLTATLLIACSTVSVQSWALPKNVAKGCATAAACATFIGAPFAAAQAADNTAFQVNVNAPYVLEMVKTEQAREGTLERINFLYKATSDFLGPAFSLDVPTDLKGVVRDALSGAATIQVNGQDVGVKVVGSEQGALTVQLSNKLLPALPFKGVPSTATQVPPADESTEFRVSVNTPYLLDLVNTEDARKGTFDKAKFLFESASNFVGPAVKAELPTDLRAVAEDALNGALSLKINGLDVGVKVVGSAPGALTVQLSNSYLPPLPFAGLPTTPAVVSQAADKVAQVVVDTAPGALEAGVAAVDKALQILNGPKETVPFWDRPIDAESIRVDIKDFHRALTPKDVAESGVVALGVIYGTSYAYHVSLQNAERQEAAAKKAANDAKRAAAMTAKTNSTSTDGLEAEPVTV